MYLDIIFNIDVYNQNNLKEQQQVNSEISTAIGAVVIDTQHKLKILCFAKHTNENDNEKNGQTAFFSLCLLIYQ